MVTVKMKEFAVQPYTNSANILHRDGPCCLPSLILGFRLRVSRPAVA
jgi:hypothetical protein